MPTDVASLWEAEANWAVQEWRAQFLSEKQRLKRDAGGLNSSRTWLTIGKAAKRIFETVSDQLLVRVRDVLTRRDDPDHIGPANLAAAALAGPLTRCALEGMPNGELVAQKRGFLSPGLLTEPLTKASQEIQQSGAVLEAALSREIAIRLEQIDAARRLALAAPAAAPPKSSETWMQRSTRWINVVRTYAWLIGTIIAIGGWAWNGFPLPF
jgi:hypothetical protein